MPAPSKLSIATSAVLRLLKEEASYHKELEQQQARIAKLEQEDNDHENADFQMRQEHKAIEETKAIFPPLRQRIMASAAQLEQQLNDDGDSAGADEIAKAKDALGQAKSLKD